MKRRKFIKLFGCAGLLFTHVMLGNVEVARSDIAIDHLSLSGPIEFNGESYRFVVEFHPKPYHHKQEDLPPVKMSEGFYTGRRPSKQTYGGRCQRRGGCQGKYAQ